MAAAVGARAGLGPDEQSTLGILATEMATNAVRHASHGQLIARSLGSPGQPAGVELLALDRGPGMANVAECLRDGFSTGGTMGNGLGAVSRLASTFDVFSTEAEGTVVLARVFSPPAVRPASPGPAIGGICLPHPAETVCGDSLSYGVSGVCMSLFAVDGLGHGASAAEASREAVRIFDSHPTAAPGDILDRVHGGLRSTRGAAAAVALVDRSRGTVRFAGVGNIAGWIVTDDRVRAMVSHGGILGHQVRRVQEFDYPLPPDALVILHSDGLTARWKLDPYPGLLRRDTAIVAGVIYRDAVRGRDDSSILVYRPGSGPAAVPRGPGAR